MKADGNDGSTGSHDNDANSPSDDNHNSHNSHSSHPEGPEPERLLPPRGDYQTLLSFQKAEIVFDELSALPISSSLPATAPLTK